MLHYNMHKINFTKMVASGNDFIITEARNIKPKGKNLNALARHACDRKYGIGADGLLVLEKSTIADVKMRIFNADGSEAQMCGNGARCTSVYVSMKRKRRNVKLKIQTKAGVIESQVMADKVKIKLTDPRNLKLDIPIKVNNRPIRVNFINTGVPHTVIFVEGLNKIDVVGIGRQIRFHKQFSPAGTNVNFAEIIKDNFINLRTYERGVEDETLACGTGSVASALIAIARQQLTAIYKINVITKGGEILKVYFKRKKNKFYNVWLEGKAKIVCKGYWWDG
jgi:diaminopimelate epimerase